MSPTWRVWAGRLALGLFAALFLTLGTLHFVRPEPFRKIVPPSFPSPALLVAISGAAELVLGVMLLIPRTRRLAGWGLIALLIAVFPANIYLYQHQDLLPADPKLHLLRLPLQGVLILWAYAYTRPPHAAKP